jgi:hypothetical protein
MVSDKTVQLYAPSEVECGAWVVLLRKYSVHWDIANGFADCKQVPFPLLL